VKPVTIISYYLNNEIDITILPSHNTCQGTVYKLPTKLYKSFDTKKNIFDVMSSQKKSKASQKLAWGSQQIPKRKASEEPEDAAPEVASQDQSEGTPDDRDDLQSQNSEDTEEGIGFGHNIFWQQDDDEEDLG
jgi:hypothetical protein